MTHRPLLPRPGFCIIFVLFTGMMITPLVSQEPRALFPDSAEGMTWHHTRVMPGLHYNEHLLLPLDDSRNDGEGAPLRSDAAGQRFWADVRRFEIIAFGTLPFTIFFSNIAYDVYRFGSTGIQEGFSSDAAREVRPLLFGDRGFDNDERRNILIAAAASSLALATIDLIIEKTRENRRQPAPTRQFQDVP